ncbi:MAG: AraC family transcriptional regulator [Polyangiales bacterium]
MLVRCVLSELSVRGIETDEMLARARITSGELQDLRARISLDRVEALLELALEASGDPGLGLAMGINIPSNGLQVLGHLMSSCRTLRQAIAHFFTFSRYIVEGAEWKLREDDELLYYTYDRPFPICATARVGAEAMIAGSLRIARCFVPDVLPTEVWFKHPPTDYLQRYEEILGCPVRFNCEVNALVAPRAVLDIEQLHADETMVAVLFDATRRVMRESGSKETVAERVRVLLRYETDLSKVDLESVARRLGLARSTVRAKLAAEGVKVSKLIDDARCRLACEELRNPDVNIKEVAGRLGFSDRTSFHRAFRRWTGQTPSQFSHATADPEGGEHEDW